MGRACGWEVKIEVCGECWMMGMGFVVLWKSVGERWERVVGDGERDGCVCAVRRKRCKVKGGCLGEKRWVLCGAL
ncbi:hypothetical protein [Bartonella schoenbuchensis]|uniref:hypothetical protein n=1 Tax=Bartonella schoenbuchensis TaxID=165694 RepID=UPI003144F713